MTIETMLIASGVLLILAGALGGGFEVQQIKIPALGHFARTVSFGTGAALILTCIAIREPKAEEPSAVESAHTDISPSRVAVPDDPPAAGTDPKVVASIRAALAADADAGREAVRLAQSSVLPAPPADDAPMEQRVAFVAEQSRVLRAELAAGDARMAAMRAIPLLETSPEFRAAYQEHVSAWRDNTALLRQLSTLTDVLAVELRSPEPDFARVQQYQNRRIDLGAALQSEQAISRTWDNVRRAALEAGVDPAQYEARNAEDRSN
jgi:hypothetical protein